MNEAADADLQARIDQVLAAPTDDFTRLIEIAGLRPDRDLRFFDWSGVDFSNCDLRGFDFIGANLSGCRFKDARIAGARFDAAQVERAALRQATDWREYARTWTRLASPPVGRHLPDLAVFSDLPSASEVVVVPAGEFLMGSADEEEARDDNERPQHEVTIGYPFAIGRYPVTFEEYDHFCEQTGREKADDRGWGRHRRPAINVSWQDACAYSEWLTEETGQAYRLPSEAEWEYACRAGTTTRYSFGDRITPKDANYDDSGHGRTTEVGSYPPNPWGLHDMHGNVWEWVEDLWHVNYQGAPADGSAWTDAEGTDSSRNRVDRGGCWLDLSRNLRSAIRNWYVPGYRSINLGFRVARTLN